MLLRVVLSFLVAVFCLTAAPSAQFAPVPGGGCPGGSVITTQGTPSLTQQITYTWFCSTRSDVPFMGFGPAIPPLFPFPSPPGCASGCMLLHPSPPIFLVGTAGRGLVVPIQIPPNPSLIGQTIHNQGMCLTPSQNCIYLGGVLATTIQP
jgi:hypothetical protein